MLLLSYHYKIIQPLHFLLTTNIFQTVKILKMMHVYFLKYFKFYHQQYS